MYTECSGDGFPPADGPYPQIERPQALWILRGGQKSHDERERNGNRDNDGEGEGKGDFGADSVDVRPREADKLEELLS